MSYFKDILSMKLAMLEPILYSLAVGTFLLAAYLFSFQHLELFALKTRPVLPHWFTSLLGIAWGQRGTLSASAFDKEKNEPLSFSNEWWQEDGIFQLEKRGIFSKSWLFVTHACRFEKPGDYRTFEIAGFSIIVILGKDRQLRCFQNVCRHRAYQVTKKECGSSTILGCRYHGWSYDTKGKLVKAPEFENVPGFDKSMNALWQVKTEVVNSLVFVNFDAREEVTNIECNKSIKTIEKWNMKDMRCVAEWKIDGRFNWKLACGKLFDMPSLRQRRTLLHSFLPAGLSKGQGQQSIGYSAITCQLPLGGLLTLRFLPRNPRTTTVELCIYAKQTKELNVELQYQDARKDLMMVVKQTENKQKRLLSGEIGFPDSEQDELRQLLKKHAEDEAISGMEIHPAAQKQVFTPAGKADDDFCRELESPRHSHTICGANAKGLLDW